MKYALTAAGKIVDRAKNDGRVVGVVGLGLSTEDTATAIQRLNKTNLPTIGSATTADDLVTASPLYYQVSPNNRREAQAAALYATRRGYRSVRIYYSGDDHDIYSKNLAADMKEEFANQHVQLRDFTRYQTSIGGPGIVMDLLGARACEATKNARELVVYAGRAEQFNAFLDGLKLSCQHDYPQILASDDVSRFVLVGQAKGYPGLKLEYMALASSALWGRDCKEASRNYSFYALYDQRFGGACDENMDGRAMLNYDALAVLRLAVANALQKGSGFPPPGATIVSGLNDIRGDHKMAAASGDIDFGGANSRVPVEKAILILRATEGQPCLAYTDGKLSTQPHIAQDCPRTSGA
jgi:hypothetical protein